MTCWRVIISKVFIFSVLKKIKKEEKNNRRMIFFEKIKKIKILMTRIPIDIWVNTWAQCAKVDYKSLSCIIWQFNQQFLKWYFQSFANKNILFVIMIPIWRCFHCSFSIFTFFFFLFFFEKMPFFMITKEIKSKIDSNKLRKHLEKTVIIIFFL